MKTLPRDSLFRSNFCIERGVSHRLMLALVFAALTGAIVLSILSLNLWQQTSRMQFVNSVVSKRSAPLSIGNADRRTEDRNVARRLPQAIIIGARKSGTRALLKFLEINPAIKVAKQEVHFFDRPQNYKLGLDWYRNQMPDSLPEQLTIEKSPAYFVTQGVAERVKEMNSSIKLILILRDPVTRLISDFSQIVAKDDPNHRELDSSNEPVLSNGAKQSIGLQSPVQNATPFWDNAGKSFERYVLRPDGGINDDRRAIKTSMYSIHLDRWRNWFPLRQFHFVDGENLIKNPHEELARVERFLLLKPVIGRRHFVFNARKGFYCLASNESSTITKEPEYLDKGNGEREDKNGKDFPGCLSRSKGRAHVAVRREIVERLRQFYAPYNEYLLSVVGHTFDWMRPEEQ